MQKIGKRKNIEIESRINWFYSLFSWKNYLIIIHISLKKQFNKNQSEIDVNISIGIFWQWYEKDSINK